MPSPALIFADVYVSPTGSDSASGAYFSPVATLAKAQVLAQAVAAASGRRPAVCMRGGTYYAAVPLALTSADNGLQLYRYPGEQPIINGGLLVTGTWTAVGGGLFSIPVNLANLAGGYSRTLYVNGVRYARAATTFAVRGALPSHGPFGVAATATTAGYNFAGNNNPIAAYRNQSDIEFVYTADYTENRCGVASSTSSVITMLAAGWPTFKAGIADGARFPNGVYPTQIENSYEILTANATPGTWYLDRNLSTLYVYPLGGVTLSTATALLGSLTNLVTATGVNNLLINGIGFAGTTSPALTKGFFDVQAAEYMASFSPTYIPAVTTGNGGTMGPYSSHLPAAVQITGGSNIKIIRGVFNNLGAAGINVEGGAVAIELAGNVMKDVGSNPIHVGAAVEESNFGALSQVSIHDNIIHDYGQEFRTSCGITVIHGAGINISNNEVYNGNYSGITMGWGWGRWNPNRDIKINGNKIHNVMRLLSDGAGIYHNGRGVNVSITNNFMYGNGNGSQVVTGVGCAGGDIYLDDGSANVTVTGNVCTSPANGRNRNAFPAVRINDTAGGNVVNMSNTHDDTVNNTTHDGSDHLYGYGSYSGYFELSSDYNYLAYGVSASLYTVLTQTTSAACLALGAALNAGLTSAYSDLIGA